MSPRAVSFMTETPRGISRAWVEPARTGHEVVYAGAPAPAAALADAQQKDHARAQAHNDAAIAAFGEGDLDAAVELLTEAIELDWSNAAFYGNRSLALQRLGQFDAALADAEDSLRCDPAYAPGCERKVSA